MVLALPLSHETSTELKRPSRNHKVVRATLFFFYKKLAHTHTHTHKNTLSLQRPSFIFTLERQGAEANTWLWHISGRTDTLRAFVCVRAHVTHLNDVSKLLKWYINNILQRQTTTAVISWIWTTAALQQNPSDFSETLQFKPSKH